jgi:hypothetical protein
MTLQLLHTEFLKYEEIFYLSVQAPTRGTARNSYTVTRTFQKYDCYQRVWYGNY